jgi:hypothetical protein
MITESTRYNDFKACGVFFCLLLVLLDTAIAISLSHVSELKI